ncbi:hypothetical protein NHQ30_001353 [Ciborinia camelliae]|nr:hypothetical protein NHQ30_001353 [Ciborinia camelliae]
MPVNSIPYKAYDGGNAYSNHRISVADVKVSSSLEERDQTLNLGSFSLDNHLEPNDVLFLIGGSVTTGVVTKSIKATCVNCFTTGEAIVTTAGLETDDSILGNILHFMKDPTGIVINALDLDLKLDFQGVTGHFEVDIAFSEAATYTFPIFTSETPVGGQLNDKDEIGLIFQIDLVFTVSGQVDVITGFEVEFPDNSYIVLNPLKGELVEENLEGIKVSAIPVEFKSGTACVTVALRYKLKAGTSVEVFGFGFKFEAGAYINAPQYRACITDQPSKPCKLDFIENFYVDVGVYAQAIKEIDYATWAAGPSAVSTLYAGTLPSKCFISSTSSIQNSLLSSSTSYTMTPTPEPETTPENSAPKTSTGNSDSYQKTATGTAPFPTNSDNGTIIGTGIRPTGIGSYSVTRSSTRLTIIPSGSLTDTAPGNSYGSGISGTAIGTLSGIIPTPSSVLFPNSTTTHSIQTYGSEPESSYIDGIKLAASPDSTITSDAPFPTATYDLYTTITASSTSTYTVYSCATEAVWCPYSMLSPVILTKTIAQYTTVCLSSEFPTGIPTIDPSAVATRIFSPLGTDTPRININITDSAPLTPCPTPITKKIEIATMYSTTGISIAAYSPTVPQVISGSTWYIPEQSLWNPPGSVTSPVTSERIEWGYYPMANSTTTGGTGTSTGIISGIARGTKTNGQFPTGNPTKTSSATDGEGTPRSTETPAFSTIANGGDGGTYGTPVVKPRDPMKRSGTSSVGFPVMLLSIATLLAALVIY